MADQSAQQLFRQAVTAAKQQDIPTARNLIQESIRRDPNNAMAWLVYASIAETKREKLLCLKKTLELEPDNAQAAKMATGMGINPADLIQAAPKKPKPAEPEQQTSPTKKPDSGTLFSFQRGEEPEEDPEPDYLTYKPETVSPPPVEDEVAEDVNEIFDDAPVTATTEPEIPAGEPPRPAPRPESFTERLQVSREEAEAIVEEFLRTLPPPDGVEWVKKDKNRAGENEIVLVRIAVAVSLFTFVGIPMIILGVILWNTPFVQDLVNPDEQSGPNVRTFTPTATPPTTPTNTPGFTPTSSVTPSPIPAEAGIPTPTETPTVQSYLREGNANINFIEPTEIYIPGGVADRAVRDGIELIGEGSYDIAQATLQVERESNITTFNALVYYTEAVALALGGETEDALELLEEGEQLRQERTRADDTTSLAAMKTGFAQVYVELGKQALANGRTGEAAQHFVQAERNAREAIAADPLWAEPRLALIESFKLRDNFNAALTAIDEAQSVVELRDDVRFIVQRGDIFFRQENYVAANYQAFTALYVDPISAQAHDLQTRIALAREDASNATLYAQTYLYYHPLIVDGWEMLGQARMMENNINLAIEAYTQAIIVGENTDQPLAIDAYLARGRIYERREQYALALEDIAKAADATGNPELRTREMYLALAANDTDRARQLARELNEEGIIPQGEANFVEARVLLATREDPTTGDYAEITQLIDSNFQTIPQELQPLANQIRANAYIEQANVDTALRYANSALDIGGETPELRFILGKIFEAQGNYADAIIEYERVLTLAQFVDVPEDLLDEANTGIQRADAARDQEIANVTATAQAR